MEHTQKTNWYSIKNIWHIAFPIILGSLAQDIITVVDTAFVGRLGEIQLGAAAIGGMFYLTLVMLGWGFGLGVQIMVARRYGQGKLPEINAILNHAFVFLMVFAVSIFIIVKLFAFDTLHQTLQSEAIAGESIRFLEFRMYGIFAAFTNTLFRAFYIGTANTKVIGITTAIMAVVNIILDYLLIFGIGIFPNMGIQGAALASVIAEYTALLFFILYTRKSKKLQIFGLFSWVPIKKEQLRAVFSISFPTMLQNFISFAVWFVFFMFVERMGELPLAISNIIRSIYIVLLVPIFGFASATNTLVSYAIGRGELNRINTVILKSMGLAMAGISIVVGALAFIPEKIISIYTNIDEVIIQTVPVFYTVMVATFTLAFGFILFQAVSGTGKTKVALFIEMIVLTVYLGVIYWITGTPGAKISTVWMVEILYGLGLGLLSLAYLKWGSWKKSTTI